MPKNLVIVESPAKARTITKFLDKEYKVLASMGHVRDLPKNRMGFDPSGDFEPEYEVSKDKKKIITELKKYIKPETVIWLATDEDREGEAISWHLISALKIEKNPIKRIVFHEITKPAILGALENPRDVDQKLVDAQQARRLLDRVVGYELSPLLWKKIKYGLSAGRVQSVAVRIIVDREREIRAFNPEEFWKIKAEFKDPQILSDLAKINGKAKKVKNKEEAEKIDKSARAGKFVINGIDEKAGKRKAPAPFTTSTLQQEASRKLSFSVKQTMMVAQQLYEGGISIPSFTGGLITYMRTDSLNLSKQAMGQAKDVITKEFGKEYAESRVFKTKSKGAQEAHEAIRPTDLSLKPSDIKQYLDSKQFRLYELIWKRTLASQMADAKVANTTVKIEAGEQKEFEFQLKGQKIVFSGFMKAYTEGSDDPDAQLANAEKILPPMDKGQELPLKDMLLEQNFTKPPARYTEASLVKKLESEGIGRPSTYAPTISTIQTRGYIEKTDDKKLAPTDIGEVVNDFLVKHFQDIVNLGFTAKMEGEFDEIAEGKIEWKKILKDFYGPFHKNVGEKDDSVSKDEVIQARELGEDPKSGKMVSVRIGRFGPMAQIGTKDDHEKPKFASLPKGASLQSITLEEALELFKLPRTLGKDPKTKEEISTNIGRFGPYVRVGKDFFSMRKKKAEEGEEETPADDPNTITLERALEIIEEGRELKKKKTIKVFEKDYIQILNGPYGPYIKQGKKNYKIPKEYEPEKLKLAECKKIIKEAPAKKRASRKAKK